MIKVNFKYIKGSKPSLILSISGHAGAGDIGEDIVCSSASTLAYTLAQTLIVMDSCGKLRKTPRTEIESGKGFIAAKPKAEALKETLHYFCMAYIGYMLLRDNYPQYVDEVIFAGLPDEDIETKKESLT